MRVLLTNNTLNNPAGTEHYCRDVAIALRAAGHEPWCYSRDLGTVAQGLRETGVPVYDALEDLPGAPDIIHGHHRLETTAAGLFFPTVPVISFCHGPKAWQEEPCRLPNVAFWVAVDRACEARLVDEEGIPADRIRLLLNFADTSRFPMREPLPSAPRRALVFSNYASEATHVPLLREVCASHGIALDVMGISNGNSVGQPETVLGDYDLVFAKARAAIEAMASGCAVIQCDYFGAGRLVTIANFDELRPWNFGFRSMTYPLDAAHLGAQVDAYSAEDARAVALQVREECSLQATLPRLLALYEEALTHRGRLNEAGMSRIAGLFVQRELRLIKHGKDATMPGNPIEAIYRMVARQPTEAIDEVPVQSRTEVIHDRPWWRRLTARLSR